MIYKILFVGAMALLKVNGDLTCSCSSCDASESMCDLFVSTCEDSAGGTSDTDCSGGSDDLQCVFSCDDLVDDGDDDMDDMDDFDDDFDDDMNFADLCDFFCESFSCSGSDASGSCSNLDDPEFGGGDDDDTCFHADTVITYKGKQYTMKELQAGKEPECTIPHTPRSRGVVIETSCNKTVRVTDTHLMATPSGFQLAYSLKAGDKLFGDYDNKEICVVESINKEKTTQTYFGLNCVHSEVLAAGVRASTFGDFHTLPSWYMYYVGGSVGVDTASVMGEYIAEWYYSM